MTGLVSGTTALRVVTEDTPQQLDTECPPVTEDACFVCDEPLREVLIIPCAAGCCDRGMCLGCATSLGYPLD